MKLATLNNGTRDGQLAVVDGDLNKSVLVSSIAKTMQEALERWDECYPRLVQIYDDLNAGRLSNNFRIFEFNKESKQVMSPLPRAFQLIKTNAYTNYVNLINKAYNKEILYNSNEEPVITIGWSNNFLSPKSDIIFHGQDCKVDFSAELAVITKSVPIGCNIYTAKDSIALVVLSNNILLNNLVPHDLSKKFGFIHSNPGRSFAPVAVTLDALGGAWVNGRLEAPLYSRINKTSLGLLNTNDDMTFNFYDLIVTAAKTRALPAGTIISSGTVSNTGINNGTASILEKRILEQLHQKQIKTEFMKDNDVVKIDITNKANLSVFGPIEQKVVIR